MPAMGPINKAAAGKLAGLRAAADPSAYEVRVVDVDLIDDHPAMEPLDPANVEWLARSIEADGLGQLPLVRPKRGGRYEAVSGRHRKEAYRLLASEGKEAYRRIPVNVDPQCSDAKARALVAVTNMFRPGETPEERGRRLLILKEEVAAARAEEPEAYRGVTTVDAVAEIVKRQTGRSISATEVKRSIKAAGDASAAEGPCLPAALRQVLDSMGMPASVAREAAALDAQGQASLLDALELEPGMSAAAARKAIKAVRGYSADDLCAEIDKAVRALACAVEIKDAGVACRPEYTAEARSLIRRLGSTF